MPPHITSLTRSWWSRQSKLAHSRYLLVRLVSSISSRGLGGAIFDPPDADYTYSVKVMLLATPSMEELYEKTCVMADASSKCHCPNYLDSSRRPTSIIMTKRIPFSRPPRSRPPDPPHPSHPVPGGRSRQERNHGRGRSLVPLAGRAQPGSGPLRAGAHRHQGVQGSHRHRSERLHTVAQVLGDTLQVVTR